MRIAGYDFCTSIFDEILNESFFDIKNDIFLEFNWLSLIRKYLTTIFKELNLN